MLGVLAALFGLALLDSLNPSALAMTLLLLTQPYAVRRVTAYLGAVFITYFGVGVLLMVGLGAFLDGFGEALQSPVAYALQGGLGAAMLGYSFLAPKPKAAPATPPKRGALGGMFVLGVSVTVLEFPTALPYLAAIGILTNAALPVGEWLPLLFAYNLVFIAPPVVLAVVYALFRERQAARFERLRERLQSGAREGLLWLLGIAGFLLLRDALAYFDFFGFVALPDAHGWLRLVAVGHT